MDRPSTIAGEPVRRQEDPRLLTGRGRYLDDLAPAGAAHAVILRAPVAHAVLRGIDAAAARSMPGVLAVLTAAEAVAVEYEDRPAVATVLDAVAPDAPAVWEAAPDNVAFVQRIGDAAAVEAALAAAHHVTTLDFAISRVSANPLEPRGALGLVAADGGLVLHSSHQSPYVLRNALAPIFGVPAEQVRVIAGDVGGAFGMKNSVHAEDVLTLWAARRLGRPVKWVSDRTEAFLSDDHGRDVQVHARLGLDRDGRFTALAVRHDINLGCYVAGRSVAPLGNLGGVAGVYATPAIAVEARGILTHTVMLAPYRGAGRPEATYTIERLIDVAARETGIDPFELRRRNLIPAAAMPHRTGLIFTYDSGDFAANMAAAAEAADRAGFPARRAAAAARGRLRGLGVSNPIEVAGGPYARPSPDHATLRLDAEGGATLHSGAMSTGQGLETALAQLVASALGLPLDRVAVRMGDTASQPSGRGSGGSSALGVGGPAALRAVEAALARARTIAADLLEAAPVDLGFAAGRFTVAGTDRSVTLAAVARAAEGGAIVEAGEFRPAQPTFPNGCHICEVEIDPETGAVEVCGYVAVEDVGRVLNPMLLAGQLHGGVAQGLGQALGEAILYDRGTGQLLSATFMDYAMPHARDLPMLSVSTLEVPTAANPLGAKGAGEAGTVGALSAAMNAVCDALAPLGIRHIDMPATPARVWQAINTTKERA